MIFCIYTLGCKVNQYESDSLANELIKLGHSVIQNLDYADAYIINTCAVTNEAEKKSRQAVAKCRSHNKESQIFVTGCASQKSAKDFAVMDKVVYVCGNKNKLKIIENLLPKQKTEVLPLDDKYDEIYQSKTSLCRANLKIQDGCNNFCSYCIIPYLRGRSRSRDLDDIIKEAKILKQTSKELVLTGIDISDYKINGKPGLLKLLKELDKLNVRIRLGSLEQKIITDDFVKSLSKLKNFCPQFHLSLQSGSDTVLKRMNRHYTSSEYYDKIKLIRTYFPKASITTDIIVGFPEETEKEFRETYKFIKKVDFAHLHVFPYSKRQGTLAEKMKQLDGKTKKTRAKIVEKLNIKLSKKYIRKNKHISQKVLIEEFVDKFAVGHSKNFIKCFVKNCQCKIGDIISVKLQKHYKDGSLCFKK